jgi:hypothetical protein
MRRFGERFERLEEQLEALLGMWKRLATKILPAGEAPILEEE